VFMLMVFGTLSLKNKRYEFFFFLSLYAAIAFEATILSYQFVANTEPCIFCLGIFSSLLLIALVANYKHFGIILAMVLAVFMGFNTLAVTKNKSFVTAPGYYLIQSKTCPHCKKVKAYLAENNIKYTPISTKEASARSFLKFVGTTSIPVLIIKDKSTSTLITGDKKIVAHFEETKVVEKVVTTPLITDTAPAIESSNVNDASTGSLGGGLSSDFLAAGGDDDAGCAITITETPSCEDDNATDKNQSSE